MEGGPEGEEKTPASKRRRGSCGIEQKRLALESLRQTIATEKETANEMRGEMATAMKGGGEERGERKALQERVKALSREHVAAERQAVKTRGDLEAMEAELEENLRRRQREISTNLAQLEGEETLDMDSSEAELARAPPASTALRPAPPVRCRRPGLRSARPAAGSARP